MAIVGHHEASGNFALFFQNFCSWLFKFGTIVQRFETFDLEDHLLGFSFCKRSSSQKLRRRKSFIGAHRLDANFGSLRENAAKLANLDAKQYDANQVNNDDVNMLKVFGVAFSAVVSDLVNDENLRIH